MKPDQVYSAILEYIDSNTTCICDLHSACSSLLGKVYMCKKQTSQTMVINFDDVKTKADRDLQLKARKSVDAVVKSPSNKFFCFVEMKSWDLCIKYNGNEKKIQSQAKKYESDLPEKLKDSIEICKQITNDNSIFDNCNIVYILVTDISVDSGISIIDSDLTALAGTSSNLNVLCNQLSSNIMNNIPDIQTRYWECRNFDGNLSSL